MDRGAVNEDKVGPGADWNNGCGNDADREDDNNGWCGNKPAAAPAVRRSLAVERAIVALERGESAAVRKNIAAVRARPVALSVPALVAAGPSAPAPSREEGVLGSVFERVRDFLASTGGRLLLITGLGLALLASGTALIRPRLRWR